MIDLRKLAKLSAADWLIIPQLVALSVPLWIGLRTLPLNMLAGFLNGCASSRWLRWFPLGHRRQPEEALYLLADRAARVTKGDRRCLVRSLLLFWMLKARHAPAHLLIGVNREDSEFRAHAWIEAQGRVLGDSADAATRFTTLLRI